MHFRLSSLIVGLIIVFSFNNSAFAQSTNWIPEHSKLPHTEFHENNTITITNFRNFTQNFKQQTIPEFQTKTFNLNHLNSVDFIVVPFGPVGIAHSMLSFKFYDPTTNQQDYLSLSVEIRRESNGIITPLRTILGLYDIIYVVGSEKDLIGNRALANQPIYLYQLTISNNKAREFLVELLNHSNQLNNKNERYRLIGNNCLSVLLKNFNKISDIKINPELRTIIPENADRLFFQLGLINNTQSFRETKLTSFVSSKAIKNYFSNNFSNEIRK